MAILVDERIYVTQEDLGVIEKQAQKLRHVERYSLVRSLVHGRVLDLGCGCGYGTWMISRNPDVSEAIGVDASEDAIGYAEKNFGTPTCSFMRSTLEELPPMNGIQCLTAIEIIEHLENPGIIADIASRIPAERVIVGYPTKKSTHYNKHHKHDMTRKKVQDMFEDAGYWLHRYLDFHGIGEYDILAFWRTR